MMTDPLSRQCRPRWSENARAYLLSHLPAALMVAVLVLAMTGCGKKAPPKPPEGDLKPPTVSDLAANRSDDILELSWTVPPTTGRFPLPAAGFRVLAYKVSLGEPCPECPPDFKAIGNLKVLGQLDRAAGKQAMRFRYPLEIGYRYTFVVVAVADDGTPGTESNRVMVEY